MFQYLCQVLVLMLELSTRAGLVKYMLITNIGVVLLLIPVFLSSNWVLEDSTRTYIRADTTTAILVVLNVTKTMEQKKCLFSPVFTASYTYQL